MKESKLKSIARDLYQDVKHSETPSDVYVNVMEIVTQQKDYFVDYIGLENVLKIIIYCWSLIKSGDFALGEKILNEMLFVVFLDSDLEHPIMECDDCGNSGRIGQYSGKLHRGFYTRCNRQRCLILGTGTDCGLVLCDIHYFTAGASERSDGKIKKWT